MRVDRRRFGKQRWRFSGRLIGLSVCLCVGLPKFVSAQLPRSICLSELAPQIEQITQRPTLARVRWGILIQTVEAEPKTLYSYAADQFFIPASNVKLLTTAVALTQLGANFRIPTSVYQIPTQTQDVVLRIVGRGDPSLTDDQLRALAQQIRQRGLRHIQTLVADDQYFQDDQINPTWTWEDVQAGYGAPVNSLILNQNAIGLTLAPQAISHPLTVIWDDPAEAHHWQIVNESITVATTAPEFVQVGRDLTHPILYVRGQLRAGSASEPVSISTSQPTQHFLDRFQQILREQHIQVDRKSTAIDPLPDAAQHIAMVASPPLSELLVETNQQSNNLYAEVLLRALAADQLPKQTSRLAAGLEALRTTLTRIGIDPTSYVLADGSGLSRQNLVSPSALVMTLQAMAQTPNAAIYKASLSTAGISGTLRNRFKNTPVQGKFYGKTGSLSGVTALSGYLEPTNATPIAMTILANYADQPSEEIQSAIDTLVERVSHLGSCSAN